MSLRVAIVHDDLTQRGGAERVVLSLHRLFPDAPIYTPLYEPAATYPEFRDCDIRTGLLQRLPGAGRHPRALLPFYPAAFGRLRLRGFDVVISSTSRFAHGVRVEGGLHVAYCESPPRFLYGEEYFGPGGPVPTWSRPLLAPLLGGLRRWDRSAAARPDVYLANSRNVAARIASLYGRSAEVIHPPLDLRRFTAAPDVSRVPAEPYFLVVSRLLPYKRVDVAIEACRRLQRRLVVVGRGPALQALRALAPTVDFRADVGEPELLALLRGCTAVLQPGVEDFGFAPLEANAAGRPAVALGAGGALETVVDGVTGVLVGDPSTEAFVEAIERVETQAWSRQALCDHAAQMSEQRFHRELMDLIEARLPEQFDVSANAHRDPSGGGVWRS